MCARNRARERGASGGGRRRAQRTIVLPDLEEVAAHRERAPVPLDPLADLLDLDPLVAVAEVGPVVGKAQVVHGRQHDGGPRVGEELPPLLAAGADPALEAVVALERDETLRLGDAAHLRAAAAAAALSPSAAAREHERNAELLLPRAVHMRGTSRGVRSLVHARGRVRTPP